MRELFEESGFLGPVPVLSGPEREALLRAVAPGRLQPPLDWFKGHGAASAAIHRVAGLPRILDPVTALLGPDVLLWGASLQRRTEGEVHPWHTDLETLAAPGGTVSVWIGLEHTSAASALKVLPGSHRLGLSVQEARHRRGRSREGSLDGDLARWALEAGGLEPRILHLEMGDGDAVFFDGRLWHGSHNTSGKSRTALLLQYARPDVPIRLPDLNHLDWPPRYLARPQPPCVLMRGESHGGVNRIVPAPVDAGDHEEPRLTSRIQSLGLPLLPEPESGWKPFPLFKGVTANVPWLSCHVSALAPGRCPHPPHRHDEEELLVLLAGQVELALPEAPAGTDRQPRLEPGGFVYYPAHFAHTLRTVGTVPANYLMFKWRGPRRESLESLVHGRFEARGAEAPGTGGFHPRVIVEGPTGCLAKLHVHETRLAPGGGYPAHHDAHDVAILTLEGEVETLGHRIGPHSLVFLPGGEPHGMRNPGAGLARYLVFEFHGT